MLVAASQPMAFLSDVHGNLPALEAVLRELGDLGVTDILVAGDLVLGGDEPLEVWRLLAQRKARCTRGLSDTALVTIDPATLKPRDEEEQARAERFADTRRSLGELTLTLIRRLPETLRIPMIDGSEIVMVHGSPADPAQEISQDMDDEEILALVEDDPADIVVCGASHVPFHRTVDGITVVNVGSVGAAPEGGVAHYTVISPAMVGARIDQRWVSY